MTWPAYQSYKDSQLPWLSSTPAHWNIGPVKRFLRSLDHVRIPLSTVERGTRQGEYPYYGASGVIDNVDDYLFDQDNVLVSEDGANLLARRTPIAFVAHGRYWVNNHAHILRPNEGDSPDFWAYRIEAESVAPFVTGAAQPKLTIEALMNLMITAPPTAEERRMIVHFVERETAKIDAVIGKQEQLIATLREDRTATITHAVTTGLDPSVELVNSNVKWLGDIPQHWVRARIRDVVVAIDSGTSVNGSDAQAEPGNVGVLKTSCVSSGWFDARANKAVLPEELSRVSCPVQAGMVIVNRANTPDLVGSAGFVSVDLPGLYLSDLLWALRTSGIEPQFLYLWMQTAVYRTQVAGWRVGTSASMQKLSKASLRSFAIALPPNEEQRAIVNFLTTRTAKIDALIAKANEVIDTLGEYRAALITDAVTGKIDVRGVA